MKNTTLCYLEKDGKYLLIHRTKKKHDGSYDKYMGVGGHFEEKESPYDCAIREVREETGLIMVPKYRAIVTFVSDKYETEHMHLFTSTEFSGELCQCDEGDLNWIDKNSLKELPMWEGDHVFLELLEKRTDFFSLKLCYEGETLVSHTLEHAKNA